MKFIKKHILNVILISLIFITNCKYFEKEKRDIEPEWSYEGTNGQDNWSSLCSSYVACSGTLQSPINIPGAAYYPGLEELQFYYQETDSVLIIYNKRMVLLKLNPKNYFSINDKTFYLKEIRFHTPSEHSIHQKHCPMEIQFIHQSNSEISALSVLVKKEKDNALLDDIINSLPDTTEKYSNVISINPSGLLPADKGYYTYNGSLTTPPCTENVKWYIMKEYLNASSDQIDKLTTYMPDNNIRAKQKLNNREILNID